MEFLSVAFKVHDPSQAKRRLLDHAFTEYTRAMGELVAWSEENLDTIRQNGLYRLTDKETGEIKSEKYSEQSIAKVLPKPSTMRADLASAIREALTSNVASMLASYLELEKTPGQETGFPAVRDPSPDGWPNALGDLCRNGSDLEQEDVLKAKVLTLVKGSFMPIHFSRSRDFALLTNKDRTKFFAWLKLLANKSPAGRNTKIDSGLITVSGYEKLKPGDEFKINSSIGVIVPLELGDNDWQLHKFVEPCLAGLAQVKAGKLIKHGDNYHLHVSVGFEAPKPYKPKAYIGIDRGVLFSMAYAVVDAETGAALMMDHNPDGFRDTRLSAAAKVAERQRQGLTVTARHYKQKELDGILHRLINKILDTAEQYQAQVVMEDLNIQIKGARYKSAFKKIGKILEYKVKLRGIPQVRYVWPAYTSKICVACGEVNQGRKLGLPFECPTCGASYHSDAGAAVNIARRAMYRKGEWGGDKDKAGDYLAFHRSFANAAGFLADFDLRDEAAVLHEV